MNGDEGIDLIVHLGAHKTASTHFERLVRDSKVASAADDVAVPLRAVIRANLTRRLSSARKEKEAGRTDPLALRRLLADADADTGGRARRVFVSDENIIGTPPRVFKKHRMYPHATKRVRAMLLLTGSSNLTCFLAIREPASFVSSAYAESMRKGAFASRDAYLGETPLATMRWTRVILALRRALGSVPLVVWTFEDYANLQEHLVRRVLDGGGGRPISLPKDSGKVREGMSQKALETIRAENEASGGPISAQRVDEIMAQFPKSEKLPGPQLFTDEEQAFLLRNYRKDLKAIREFPNVEFLPHDEAAALTTKGLKDHRQRIRAERAKATAAE